METGPTGLSFFLFFSFGVGIGGETTGLLLLVMLLVMLLLLLLLLSLLLLLIVGSALVVIVANGCSGSPGVEVNVLDSPADKDMFGSATVFDDNNGSCKIVSV